MPLRSRSRNRFVAFVFHYRWIPTVVIHLTVAALTNYTAFLLRFDGHVPPTERALWLYTLPLLLACRAVCFFGFRMYQGLWRYTSIWDLRNLVGAALLGSVVFWGAIHGVMGATRYPRSVYVVDTLLLIVTLSTIRLSRRVYSELSGSHRGKRVLVFGAGNAGELIVRDMKGNREYGYQPIGFVDDDIAKVGRRIHGVQVLGTRQDLKAILAKHKPDEMLIAMPNADAANIRAIVRALEAFKLPIKTLPKLSDIIGGVVELNSIRNLAVEDLLARPPVGLDPQPVKHLIRGRRVMVTGAGGSIGSELCRQIVKLKPASLVMFERYENSLHAIRMELEDAHPGCGLHSIVGDVADTACVSAVMQQHLPEIVFHAAAHKHVPLMEENPCEAIKNNVRGTRLLAQASEFFGVDRFIFISTDKAVNPTSVMGASKRLAELAIQTQALGSGTSFAVVRFGNVLGSNGSVVPRFLDQIRKGGPVTITHPEMRRFFMLIPEAVQLVMHAASQAESGGIYVLEMGEQVRLVDMAKDLIRLAGFVPEEEIPIEFIGLRPGEKLYEELVGVNEVAGPSAIDKIHRVTSRRRPDPEFFTQLETIENQAAEGDVPGVRASLKRLIPEYTNPAEVVVTQVAQVDTEPIEADAEEEAEMSQVEGDVLYQYCPSCISARVHRSRARTIVERVRRNMTAERLFRCEQCGWRGWLMPLVRIESEPVDHTVQPDLSALDGNTAAPSVAAARRRFSPRDLQ
jgi:FlaA1/EpsC-like NDP-sugar epimerase